MRIKYSIKNAFSFIVVILLLIFLSSFISALTVVVPDNLNLYPGQTYDTAFVVMNTIPGSGKVVLEAQFSEGSEIVSFTKGNRFEVLGESTLPTFVRFKIPVNAAVGTVYLVRVSYRTVSEGVGSGSVSFAEDVDKSFNVRIIEKPAEEVLAQPQREEAKTSVGAQVWIWILVVIIIIIIAWMILRKKRR